ncbi:hypothetical protein [Paramagnetospirillum marisnigri]|uniref:hypothetical protein n=1 Tax=Paramagnetospirillum marisnigri TaxID=1285242 RepID=UPI000A794E5C|nr:hypothetical protein [Paramagnetospirillum marisnigri]
MSTSIIPGTCGACSQYSGGQCQSTGSQFSGKPVWALSCLPCQGYRRSSAAATPVDPVALEAVVRRAMVNASAAPFH